MTAVLAEGPAHAGKRRFWSAARGVIGVTMPMVNVKSGFFLRALQVRPNRRTP